jgi:hypothetical protein
MYQPHPDKDTLFAGMPTNLVAATENIQPIRFEDLLEMRRIVWELAAYITDWKPHLIPFFATGGIPYLIPVMHVLLRARQYGLLDGKHFHLFPGLSWGGSTEGQDSENYFATTFGEVVRKMLGTDGVLRVLVIDTTNSGNAINKAVAACQRAFTASAASNTEISLRVVGIVNTSHPEANAPDETKKRIIVGTSRTAHLLTPSGFAPAAAIRDRRFTSFAPMRKGEDFSFELSYWLAGNIPTEDKAELIGVEAVHESLSTTSEPRAGRLQIIYGNGETQQGASHGPLHGTLISLLSMPLTALPWERMQAINDLPPLDDAQRESLTEVREMSDGGLRIFELGLANALEQRALDIQGTVNALSQAKRLLTDVEVYWLRTIDPPPKSIARKVRASLEKGTCSTEEALTYFRLAFPELVTNDPGGDGSAAWWDEQVRSMPKEVFTVEAQAPIHVRGYEGDPSRDDQGEEEAPTGADSEWDDLILSFVALAGGIEEARRLLSDLRFRGMSLEEVESYLKEAWPIGAGKTMSFVSPTNEQVAMQFVLDCGGYEQATARLEDWVAKLTGNQ